MGKKRKNENLVGFANRFELLLRILGVSQRQFADLIRVDKGSISNYKNAYSSPSVEIIHRMAIIFNVNPTWLVTGNGEMFIPSESALPTEQAPLHETPIANTLASVEISLRKNKIAERTILDTLSNLLKNLCKKLSKN